MAPKLLLLCANQKMIMKADHKFRQSRQNLKIGGYGNNENGKIV